MEVMIDSGFLYVVPGSDGCFGRSKKVDVRARSTKQLAQLKLSLVGPSAYQSIDQYHGPIDFFLSYWLNCSCVLAELLA